MIPKPFDNIALSFSGGGYRAACFHLGVLSLLQELKFNYKGDRTEPGPNTLLKRVKILSTNSGGTITGALYAIHAAKGLPFENCFNKLYNLLERDKLLENVFQKLNHTSSWSNIRRNKNLINAFAEVYHKDFYEEETFGLFEKNTESHLEDIIFNATEFTNGLHFRFQTKGRIGNGKLDISPQTARNIRIADMVAASSCFPAGFEPIIFPSDFAIEPLQATKDAYLSDTSTPFALMDGGIVDNQGIDSVLLAEDRNRTKNGSNQPFIGTYLISDVSSGTIDPYPVPNPKVSNIKRKLSFRWLNFAAISIALLAFIFLLLSMKMGMPQYVVLLVYTAFLIPAIYLLIFNWFWIKLKKKVKGLLGREAPEIINNFHILKKTPLYILQQLVNFRITSSLKMVEDLFMKRIRDLQYNSLYKDKYWRYRIKSNNIYALKNEKQIDLGQELQAIVDYANTMETTLWFSKKQKEEEMLQKLIVCGQATTCHNLMEYIDSCKNQSEYELLSKEDQNSLNHFYIELLETFEKFKKDPYWLLERLRD